MTRPFLAALLLLTASAAHGAGDKVGAETCKACHPAAYDAWKAGPHARALDGLTDAQRKDARCVVCHAPDLADGISAVSCEACHGPGRRYAAPYVMRDPELARAVGLLDPGPRTCLACHGESTPSLVKFDPARKLPLIDHWTVEREARRAPPSAAPAAPVRPVPPATREH